MGLDKTRVESIFYEAISKPVAERADFLAQACGEDPELRQRVQALLSAREDAGDFLNLPSDGPTTHQTLLPPSTLQEIPGAVIGRYKLLEQIGEGGFGVVFMAEQENPVRRKVALKIIKLGMDTKQVVARFEAERQALAMMDHPNIARVLDGGSTDTGRPYFVMQLVKGIPITTFCNENKLNTRERLDLFAAVCNAVQHAHQKGIIHRDLKPSNVLVTMRDDKPVPMVIDFGIAKATQGRLTERTMFTEFRQMIGTPAYMSPEQAQMTDLDVDTRSDIYTLGVLLYELLTGNTPFNSKELLNVAYGEMQRIIREVEPPKPSTRLSTLGQDALSAVADQRRCDPTQLSRMIRGDLDWIVMKCLEKDRTRRYETANGLARDIQRFMAVEPVEASPPSAIYRMRKFSRRHRKQLYIVALIAALLVSATVVSIRQAVRAARAQVIARQERDNAVAEKKRADEQAGIAQAVNDFLTRDVLAQAAWDYQINEGRVPDPDLRVRDALDNAASRIAGRFDNQLQIKAAIEDSIGIAYSEVGQFDKSQEQLNAALKLDRALYGDNGDATLAAMGSLVWVYMQIDRNADAETMSAEIFQARKAALGPDDPSVLAAEVSLADVCRTAHDYPRAERLFQEALAGQRRTLGDLNETTLNTTLYFGVLYDIEGEYAKAEPLYLQALDGERRNLDEQHQGDLPGHGLGFLASLYHEMGQYAKAQEMDAQVVEWARRTLGDTHPNTLNAITGLAIDYMDEGQYAKAEPLLIEALSGKRKITGDQNSLTLWVQDNLGRLYTLEKQYGKAEALLLPILNERPNRASTLYNLAVLYGAEGMYKRSEPLFQRALEIQHKEVGERHPDTLRTIDALAQMYEAQDDPAQAEPLFLRALSGRRLALGPQHPDTLTTARRLISFYEAHGQSAKAAALQAQFPGALPSTRALPTN